MSDSIKQQIEDIQATIQERKAAYQRRQAEAQELWRKQARDVDVHNAALESGEIDVEEWDRRLNADVYQASVKDQLKDAAWDLLEQAYRQMRQLVRRLEKEATRAH